MRPSSGTSPRWANSFSRSCRSDSSLVSMTTSDSWRTPSSSARSWAMELAMPRVSSSGWRCRVSENRRIRISSRASRKNTCGRIPRPSSAPRTADRRERRVAGPHVKDDGRQREAGRVRGDELREVGQELPRQVVDDDVAEVLEQLGRGRLPAARQARDDGDVRAAQRHARPRCVVLAPRARARGRGSSRPV